jgi:hypothetical protein
LDPGGPLVGRDKFASVEDADPAIDSWFRVQGFLILLNSLVGRRLIGSRRGCGPVNVSGHAAKDSGV